MSTQPRQTRKPRKQTVRWTEDEEKRVLEAAFDLAIKDTHNLWDYMARAQSQVLTPDRRRVITGRGVTTAKICAAYNAIREKKLAELAQAGEIIELRIEVPVPAPFNRANVLKSITTPELMELVVERTAPFLDVLRSLAAKDGQERQRTPHPEHHQIPELDPGTEQATGKAADASAPVLTPTGVKSTIHRVLLFGFPDADEVEIRQKSAGFNVQLEFRRQDPGQPVPSLPSCNWCIVGDPDWTRRAKKLVTAKAHPDRIFHLRNLEEVMKRLAIINSIQPPRLV